MCAAAASPATDRCRHTAPRLHKRSVSLLILVLPFMRHEMTLRSACFEPPRAHDVSRRICVYSAASALLGRPLPSSAMSFMEAAALEEKSRSAEGTLLANGVRVIDVMTGKGAEPSEGQRVYVHYKFWTGQFDEGMPVDSTYLAERPVDFELGNPSGRVFPGLDAGIRGMREGGWRRFTVPSELGFGEAGLPKQKISRKTVAPGEKLYVDVHLMDSKRCDKVFREQGYKTSMNCERLYR
eukprot:TRINITY_DN15289_c0_g1_i1.p1 TRINITY_DN15289_c0_g1~~TRINITY_DN15289_c0_g1_i1.p1  ORF type:complete len:276 (-),score=35.72 TRINITY_DN15289_c0_g1_i1:60-776(-)